MVCEALTASGYNGFKYVTDETNSGKKSMWNSSFMKSISGKESEFLTSLERIVEGEEEMMKVYIYIFKK